MLYADDDSDDLALIREAFSQYSHAVDLHTFSSGTELLQFIEFDLPPQATPCLIILDINMPRLNGLEILKKLRCKENLKDVPVVLFSTSTLPAEAAYAKKFQAGFVTKPLVASQVYQTIEQLIGHCTEEVRKRINWK